MSRIDDLIAQLCPDGVEFFRVGEIAQVGTGSSDRKDAVPSGEFPFYVRSKEILRIGKFEFDEEAIVIPGEGGIGEIFHFVTGKYALHQRAYRINFRNPSLDTKFAYYYFAVHFKNFILQKAVNATVTSIRKPMITDFRVPVPPIEVQREIVRILDTFTQLEAELEAELEARRIQYAHYRDSLLMSPNWPSALFGQLATIARGASPRPIRSHLSTQDDGVPWIKIGDVDPNGKYVTTTAEHITPDGAKKSKRIFPGDFILSNSMSFGRPYISKIEGCIHDGWLSITNYDQSFRSDFLFHLLRSSAIQAQFESKVGSSTVSNLNAEIVRGVSLPIPSLEEQDRIVRVLDGFESLTNDLSIGLPAELEARRKQYAYYRDKLLTFKELPA